MIWQLTRNGSLARFEGPFLLRVMEGSPCDWSVESVSRGAVIIDGNAPTLDEAKKAADDAAALAVLSSRDDLPMEERRLQIATLLIAGQISFTYQDQNQEEKLTVAIVRRALRTADVLIAQARP